MSLTDLWLVVFPDSWRPRTSLADAMQDNENCSDFNLAINSPSFDIVADISPLDKSSEFNRYFPGYFPVGEAFGRSCRVLTLLCQRELQPQLAGGGGE